MPKKTRKLVTLTPEQDKIWQSLFAIGVNDGETDEQADRSAWEGLVEQFPELAQYDGIDNAATEASSNAAERAATAGKCPNCGGANLRPRGGLNSGDYSCRNCGEKFTVTL
jgi:hypothetical protein